MRKKWLARLWAFDRRRFKIFSFVLVCIIAFAILGTTFGIRIPLLGTYILMAAFYIWLAPGILFHWTGLFEYNQFGAAPNGALGNMIILLFYMVVALVVTWPFAPKRDGRKGPRVTRRG